MQGLCGNANVGHGYAMFSDCMHRKTGEVIIQPKVLVLKGKEGQSRDRSRGAGNPISLYKIGGDENDEDWDEDKYEYQDGHRHEHGGYKDIK